MNRCPSIGPHGHRCQRDDHGAEDDHLWASAGLNAEGRPILPWMERTQVQIERWTQHNPFVEPSRHPPADPLALRRTADHVQRDEALAWALVDAFGPGVLTHLPEILHAHAARLESEASARTR